MEEEVRREGGERARPWHEKMEENHDGGEGGGAPWLLARHERQQQHGILMLRMRLLRPLLFGAFCVCSPLALLQPRVRREGEENDRGDLAQESAISVRIRTDPYGSDLCISSF